MKRQESLQEYIDRVVASFSPLSAEKRDKLASLLHPAGGGGRDG